MAEKYYTVKLEIAAPSKAFVERMLERMPSADRIVDDTIIDPDEPILEARIRYDKNWCGEGEHFVFENKWTNEDDWGLDSAFPCVTYKDGTIVRGEGDLLNYQALTKVRELLKLGIPFYFK